MKNDRRFVLGYVLILIGAAILIAAIYWASTMGFFPEPPLVTKVRVGKLPVGQYTIMDIKREKLDEPDRGVVRYVYLLKNLEGRLFETVVPVDGDPDQVGSTLKVNQLGTSTTVTVLR
jgi:hypothetical protein